MTLTEQQIELLKATSLQDGRNAWEYIHLYEEGKQPWVAAGILSCISQGLNLLPEIISTEAGHLKYGECKITELTEQQKQVCPYPDFWEMQERSRRFQEFLPPLTVEEVIAEMKSRGQYNPTGWEL